MVPEWVVYVLFARGNHIKSLNRTPNNLKEVQVARKRGRGGGVIRAMPKRKHLFLWEVFPKVQFAFLSKTRNHKQVIVTVAFGALASQTNNLSPSLNNSFVQLISNVQQIY